LYLRRVMVELDEPTRDGDTYIAVLCNLPEKDADARAVAKLYRRRWTIEHAFEDLALALECEINTLCYPKAALFGFCVGLVVYNLLAVVRGALRGGAWGGPGGADVSLLHGRRNGRGCTGA